MTATNGEGLASSQHITITVQALASPHAPFAGISSPADNTQFLAEGNRDPSNNLYYKDVHFTASASDPDGDQLSYIWTDSVNSGQPTQVSSQLSPTLRLYHPDAAPSGDAIHDLLLSVSDGTNVTTVPIRIRVYVPG